MQHHRIVAALLVVIAGVLVSCKSYPSQPNIGVAGRQTPTDASRSAATAPPAKALPQGFQSYNDPNGTGRLIYIKSANGGSSAVAAMRQFLASLRGAFDAPLHITAATGDQQNTVVQAMLTTEIAGQPIQGVAAVAIGQESSIAGLIYDRPGALRVSYPRLSSYFSKQIGQPPPSAQASAPALDISTWTRQTGGDRSTTVLLPPSWRLSSVSSGSVNVDGPNKEQVVLGFQFFVTPNMRIYAPYMPPEQALTWFWQTQNVRLVRVIDHKEAGKMNPGGEAEFFTAEFQKADGAAYKALLLVMTNPMQMNIWKFYLSYIAAPEEQFAAEYPTMFGIWQNWKLDPRYVQERMDETARIEAQTRSMMMEGAQRSMHAFDNVNEAWDEVIRGVDTMENTDTGGRAEVPIGSEQRVIHACERQGINCRVVPTDELVQPQ